MKAAVLKQLGDIPVYGEIDKPIAQANQVLVKMQAATIKQLDKLKVSGKHYTTFKQFPTTVGVDGVGILDNGQRIYALGLTGMLAEYALVAADNYVTVPDNLSSEIAALLPNALLGSDAALIYRAQMQQGQVVLINGATGVSGRMAVQAAKLRGASYIIATGRNPESLAYLKQLGADQCVSLLDTEEEICQQLETLQNTHPIDHILDYLWGRPTALLLQVLGNNCPKAVNLVTIGQMAGATIDLASSSLRSKPISLLGSGFGSISAEQLENYHKQHLPKMFQLAAEGALVVEYDSHPLAHIERAWQAKVAAGSRIVITI
ncbi:zinc-binding alcohol dehydrogenase family protein [Pseudomonas sp. F1_0610]|uniref:quinone oxidoreductase family protein n=1 Tax=Pseudomonas sp. F1_0610 TaxID=3114284 RepID=UPI0039C2280A